MSCSSCLGRARGSSAEALNEAGCLRVFAALAEFIRELIIEGTREGLDAARARGARLGRPPAMTAEQIRQARDLLTRPDNTVSSIARLLGVSRATIYKYVPEVTTGRQAAALPPGQE
ncbi:MAG: recombinase family protein [Streptosporangiaceae bacterium]